MIELRFFSKNDVQKFAEYHMIGSPYTAGIFCDPRKRLISIKLGDFGMRMEVI
jgi:hypothetical protein